MTDSPRTRSLHSLSFHELKALCIADAGWTVDNQAMFAADCDALKAAIQLQLVQRFGDIQETYRDFNPMVEAAIAHSSPEEPIAPANRVVVETFQTLLHLAGYAPLPQAKIQDLIDQSSVVNVRTQVDFTDFEHLLGFYRGETTVDFSKKRFLFLKKRQVIPAFEHLALLIQFKDESHFQPHRDRDKRKADKQPFIPGKIHVFFYQNLPQSALNLLFPNLRVKMTWRDRLLFLVPAIGAAVPILVNLLLSFLFILWFLVLVWNPENIRETIQQSSVTQEFDNWDGLRKIAITLFLLGTFTMQQRWRYRAKRLQFYKDITDALLIRNLGNHASVFPLLMEQAATAISKQAILVYYHLLTAKQALTTAELDAQITAWLQAKATIQLPFHSQAVLPWLTDIAATQERMPAMLIIQDSRDRYRAVLPTLRQPPCPPN